jgi:hypothetical protein
VPAHRGANKARSFDGVAGTEKASVATQQRARRRAPKNVFVFPMF